MVVQLGQAADTNTSLASVIRPEPGLNPLQLQEQLHAAELVLLQNQLAASEAARTNAETIAARIHGLEQMLAAQNEQALKNTISNQQLTIILAGFACLGSLGIMLLLTVFQWRALKQLTRIASQHEMTLTGFTTVHQLAAPGRSVVQASSDRLLNTIDELKKRIQELESPAASLPASHADNGSNPIDLLGEAQKFLDAHQPQSALASLGKILAQNPDHAEALVKKAAALDKLGRTEEALADCDRAIAADNKLALAHLQKGGLLSRLRRYDEALNCFELALAAQEKASPTRA